MSYQLWYKEGIGEPRECVIGRKYFQSFTKRIGAGTFATIEELRSHMEDWDSYRAVWEIEACIPQRVPPAPPSWEWTTARNMDYDCPGEAGW